MFERLIVELRLKLRVRWVKKKRTRIISASSSYFGSREVFDIKSRLITLTATSSPD